jgi:hypothetical protein
MPEVKPVVTGNGMKRISAPARNTPIRISMTPATRPASRRLFRPYCRTMTERMATIAPVGPPTWTRDPPKMEMAAPATMAV